MENQNRIDSDYFAFIKNNPDKDFVMYLRNHIGNANEDIVKNQLVNIYGECKEVTEESLIIFIIKGNKIEEFIEQLEAFKTTMYLSFIQSADELINANRRIIK